jgi:hypothetical protein
MPGDERINTSGSALHGDIYKIREINYLHSNLKNNLKVSNRQKSWGVPNRKHKSSICATTSG